MGTRQSFSKDFKESVLTKILSRGNRTIEEICLSEGVNKSTAVNWVRSHGRVDSMTKKAKHSRRSPEAKLKALIELGSLSDSEQGIYLRKEGLFSHDVEAWKGQFISSMTSTEKKRSNKDNRDQKIRVLEREVRRKDKALAEASALLILQKKVNLIWGDKNEDDE